MAADEVFLANSLAGIVPVGRLGDRVWSRFTECLQLRGVWLARAQKESRSWSEV
jgi:branched-subunit amino acid aminotransferase/4-amino-4-deoxychorismate lyase